MTAAGEDCTEVGQGDTETLSLLLYSKCKQLCYLCIYLFIYSCIYLFVYVFIYVFICVFSIG